jgi:hypothetical protein
MTSNAFKLQEVVKDMNKIIDISLARVSQTRNPCSHASDDVISVRIDKFLRVPVAVTSFRILPKMCPKEELA